MRPPPGWRKPMPITIKLQVIVNQRGLAPNGEPLDAQYVGIHFDHRPPLHERLYDPERDDTVPAANDIGFIVALPTPDHQDISGKDVTRIRKTDDSNYFWTTGLQGETDQRANKPPVQPVVPSVKASPW